MHVKIPCARLVKLLARISATNGFQTSRGKIQIMRTSTVAHTHRARSGKCISTGVENTSRGFKRHACCFQPSRAIRIPLRATRPDDRKFRMATKRSAAAMIFSIYCVNGRVRSDMFTSPNVHVRRYTHN